jgi:predicted metal-dependent peptidase
MAWAGLAHPDNYGLPVGQHFEWYANQLSFMDISPEDGTSDEASYTYKADGTTQTANAEQTDTGNTGETGQDENLPTDGQDSEQAATNVTSSQEGSDASQDYTSLWEEDVFMNQELTNIINGTTHWGSLPGNMVQLIQKATEGKIDYRNALRAFRTSILSQKRHLTRMRPSRRFGFEQMGSRYEFTTRMLVAVDTSGSVGSNGLARFFRIITTFFKYGIQEIDVLMFDTIVQGKLMTLTEAKKNKQTFEVKGRGGTNFQVPIDYVVAHPDYDALIILTDGEAPVPKVPALLCTKILWVIDNSEYFYKRHYEAFRKTGRVCWMEL